MNMGLRQAHCLDNDIVYLAFYAFTSFGAKLFLDYFKNMQVGTFTADIVRIYIFVLDKCKRLLIDGIVGQMHA